MALWRELAPRFFYALRESELLSLLYHLLPSSTVLAEAVPTQPKWQTFDDMLFYHSLAACFPQVRRLLEEPENRSAAEMLSTVVRNEFLPTTEEARALDVIAHDSLRKVLSGKPGVAQMRFVVLESFILRYLLSTVCNTRQSLETVLSYNRLEYGVVTRKLSKRQRQRSDDSSSARFLGFRLGDSATVLSPHDAVSELRWARLLIYQAEHLPNLLSKKLLTYFQG